MRACQSHSSLELHIRTQSSPSCRISISLGGHSMGKRTQHLNEGALSSPMPCISTAFEDDCSGYINLGPHPSRYPVHSRKIFPCSVAVWLRRLRAFRANCVVIGGLSPVMSSIDQAREKHGPTRIERFRAASDSQYYCFILYPLATCSPGENDISTGTQHSLKVSLHCSTQQFCDDKLLSPQRYNPYQLHPPSLLQ